MIYYDQANLNQVLKLIAKWEIVDSILFLTNFFYYQTNIIMYKIQRATINDVPEIAQFAAKTFSDTFQHYSPEDLKNHLRKTCSESYFSNQINNTENKTIIIKENNNIIAYAKYGKLELPVNNPVFPSNELHRLYVDPKNKYSGIGSQLITYVFDKAIQEKNKSIYLGVYTDNTIAINFYRKHGFQKIGEYNYFVGPHIDREHIMQKIL